MHHHVLVRLRFLQQLGCDLIPSDRVSVSGVIALQFRAIKRNTKIRKHRIYLSQDKTQHSIVNILFSLLHNNKIRLTKHYHARKRDIFTSEILPKSVVMVALNM